MNSTFDADSAHLHCVTFLKTLMHDSTKGTESVRDTLTMGSQNSSLLLQVCLTVRQKAVVTNLVTTRG